MKVLKQEFETIKRTTLTTEEAAKYLGLSRDMIYILARENRIPHVRIGRRVLFKKQAIDMWLDEQLQGSVLNEE